MPRSKKAITGYFYTIKYWWEYRVRQYIRGWYRRIFWQWFSPYKLVAVRSIKRSHYRDMDTILVEAVFQLFIDFIERECNGRKGLQRSIVESQKYLNECNLKKGREEERSIIQEELATHQKMLELFEYATLRRHRPDPHDVYSYPKYCYIDKDGNLTNEMLEPTTDEAGIAGHMRKSTPEYSEWCHKTNELETRYYEEDTQKAMEILKIRHSLWT